MMLASMMILGHKTHLNSSLAPPPRLGKGLMRKIAIPMHLCFSSRRCFSYFPHQNWFCKLQWFHCLAFICSGVKSEGHIPWNPCCYQIPCSHKIYTSGMPLFSKWYMIKSWTHTSPVVWFYFCAACLMKYRLIWFPNLRRHIRLPFFL